MRFAALKSPPFQASAWRGNHACTRRRFPEGHISHRTSTRVANLRTGSGECRSLTGRAVATVIKSRREKLQKFVMYIWRLLPLTFRWILSELRSESGSPIRGSSRLSGEEGIRENGLPAPLNKTGKANMPAQGPLFSRSPNGASRPKERNGGRRTRQGEAGEVSTWNVGSPTRHCSRSTFTQARPVSGSDSGKELRSEYHQLPSSDGPHVGKLDRAGGLVGDDPKARHRRDRQLSMRSADEAREIGSGGLALGSSTPSAGSAPSALGAR